MRRNLLLAAACALLLGACAYPHHRMPGDRLGDSRMPQVTIVGGQMRTTPEILLFRPGERDVTITWSLPREGKLRFPANGIVIEGQITEQQIKGERPSVVLDPRQQEIVDCKRGDEGLTFSCFNRHTKPGIYKYTIRVLDGDRVIERDPFVMNM